ncbi:MAG: putative molybdenum carrier protein [Candidatus Nomurabacteria bacterium]|jgi:hypothetical protein|nr:putative molybdenum carrier protein [Candidatus Nomurabacteria bacterium]
MKIVTIRSGGQTGVDRAALDVAREFGMAIAGWCPRGGVAEDHDEAPGLLVKYPELRETNYSGYSQRTVLNVWDADATLIFYPVDGELSPGTELTVTAAKKLKKPYFIMRHEKEMTKLVDWLNEKFADREIELNIAGPRASSIPDIYDRTRKLLGDLFGRLR